MVVLVELKEYPIEEWQTLAKTYPTKVLIYVAEQLRHEQATLLEGARNRQVGQAWSPEQWDER